MRLPRQDMSLNDALEVLDEKFALADSDFARAWDSLTRDELDWVDGELAKAISNRRYFLENYYVIKDEHGRLQTLYPYWPHQEVVAEVMEREWEKNGCYRIIILKPRQCGGTTWAGGVTFHATVFTPQAFTLIMAHEEDASAEIYRRMWDAYNNLPWWMRPEKASKQQERHVIFQRADEKRRVSDPGLGSTIIISNAQKGAGVAIGRTVRCAHFSEVSRWPDSDIWTADIEPSMNARDTQAFMESTAWGRTGLFYHMWHAAESGESEWIPVFIPVYKVRKYFLPIKPEEKFSLTVDEKSLRAKVKEDENFTIPLGFFKWRRKKIQAAINAKGSDESHYEAYPVTPGEAFISSGFCAFPRKCLNEQAAQHCRDPKFIGEIHYISPDIAPELVIHPPKPSEIAKKPDLFNRLWIWEEPDSNQDVEYYLGADVSAGDGQDFSDAQVFRMGRGPEPHVQVAEWHGLINASHFARVLAALGFWYHQAEIAVEYTQAGITTGDELCWVLDYPNLYRWKHMDKISNTMTQHVHWVTNSRTRDDAINRMAEALLDKTVILRNKFLIEEMRDFGRFEGEIKASGMDNNDDQVLAAIICLAAAHQSGKRVSGDIGESPNPALTRASCVYALYDHLNRQLGQFPTRDKAESFVISQQAKYTQKLNLTIREIPVMKANSAYSPIFDGTGAENELYKHGVPAREIRPELVHGYRDLMTRTYYQNED